MAAVPKPGGIGDHPGTSNNQQQARDHYVALAPIKTAVSARTMSLDPKTGDLFVAGADTDSNPRTGGRPKVRPGTLKLLIFNPNS